MRPLRPALLCLGLLGCSREPVPPATEPGTAAPASAPGQDFAYAELDIADLQERMTDGNLSSRELTQAYLDRIAAIDDAGPRLNAVIELNPEALEEADARDAEREAGKVRGPLHGIPMLLKDNIDATPLVTSAESLALAEHRPDADAFPVPRLPPAAAGTPG